VSILLTIFIVIILIGISAVCSGLNVALMSLNIDELRRKSKLGNSKAAKVYPYRKNTHLSLAAILLTNVAAVSATSLVLESVLFGLLAGLITTLLMVTFGEIFPQALFSRKSLTYTARFTPALRTMIFITYPISKPLQLLLDKLFDQPQSQLHSRQELGIMITEHLGHQDSELDEDEVEIIRGALQLSEKHATDIMMPIDEVFWLTPDTELTPEKVAEIKEIGRSRIPIFNQRLTSCSGILLMKDLVDVDFDEEPVFVNDLDLYPVQLVGSRTALDTLLRKFISTSSHLIPIEKDDHIVGIATIEDLIEEIVGQEIEDETDKRQAMSPSASYKSSNIKD
jgi:metal transporter CNNM